MGSGFFTQVITPRAGLFRQIHEIVYHGNGGYDWATVYNMPIWLRKYTFDTIKEFLEKQAEAQQKAAGKQTIDSPQGPPVAPNYTSKKTSR